MLACRPWSGYLLSMSSQRAAAEGASPSGVDQLQPESVTSEGLPVAMRGYDRERVDRLLSRVSEAYLQLWRQRDALRERLATLESDVEAAEGEARVSAKSVAELVQRVSTAENELAETRAARDELTERLQRAEAERRQAVGELRGTAERAAQLEKRVQAFEEALRSRPQIVTDRSGAPLPSPGSAVALASSSAASETEAARLLIAAARASDQLREAAREQARDAMKKVRQRAAAVSAETERERIVLVEAQERRRRAEREAEELLARARAEAERVAAALDEERERVRALLTDALSSLDQEPSGSPEGLVADLSSRLRESGAPDSVDASVQALEPHA